MTVDENRSMEWVSNKVPVSKETLPGTISDIGQSYTPSSLPIKGKWAGTAVGSGTRVGEDG